MKGAEMNRANKARRNAEAKALAEILRERARSGASGAHGNKATKRANTRSASKAKSLREWF